MATSKSTGPVKPRDGAKREARLSQALVTEAEPRSAAAEAYRTLTANVRFAGLDRPCRTIVVTSATSGEGKTTTAANFSVALSQTNARVCLIDADLRRPAMHRMFALPNTRGLSTALVDGLTPKEVAQPTRFPNLFVIPSGPLPPNPAEAVGSQRMREFLAMLVEEFDTVVLDSPPMVSVSDGMVLSAICDGTIFVVRTGIVPSDVVRRAAAQIGTVKGRILGVVLNSVDMRRDGEYYDYYRYYSAYYGGTQKS